MISGRTTRGALHWPARTLLAGILGLAVPSQVLSAEVREDASGPGPSACPTDPGLPAWEVRGAASFAGWIPDLALRAGEFRREALVEVPRRTGVLPGASRLRWLLDLSPPAGPGSGASFLEAGTTRFGGDGAVVVEIAARRFLRRPGDLRTVIFHEAAHAVMASRAGSRDRYLRIPWWFREGVALLAAGEGLARVEELLAYLAFRERPANGFLVGIPLGESGARSRSAARSLSPAEAWLAVDWIESRLGAAGLRELCLAVSRGASLEDELASRLGPLDRTRAWIFAAARERTAGILPPERERTFRESLETARQTGPSAALVAWRDLLGSGPTSCLAPTLRYLLGRELSTSSPGSPGLREAAAHLGALVDGPGTLWRAEALVLLGECLDRQGDPEGARWLWEEALEAFPDDAIPAGRAKALLGR